MRAKSSNTKKLRTREKRRQRTSRFNADCADVSAGRRLRSKDSQGHEARRSSGAGPDQVRVGDQSQDCESARPHRATDAARARRRGNRVKRREFITLLGGAAVASWSRVAAAQQARLPLVGVLRPNPKDINET